MGRLAMLMAGLGHAWAGSSATVAAVVARPLRFRAASCARVGRRVGRKTVM